MFRYLALVFVALAGAATAATLADQGAATRPTTTQTTGHDPVTICHKPGTPAEQELVVDDDSTVLSGHLSHGDTIGPCPTGTTTETTTQSTTTETETEPPTTTTETEQTTTETTPPVPCVPQNPDGSLGGQNGIPGNDSCARDPEPTTPNDTVTLPSTPTETTATEPETTQETTTQPNETNVPPAARPPASSPPAKPHPKPAKPHTPPMPPRTCAPGGIETSPCGVQGSG